jgi:hypothetical protein
MKSPLFDDRRLVQPSNLLCGADHVEREGHPE